MHEMRKDRKKGKKIETFSDNLNKAEKFRQMVKNINNKQF